MAEDGFAAFLVEFCDPVRLDVPLAVESEFLFDSEFNGKPVAAQPALRGTKYPCMVLKRGKMSLKTRASMWWVPGTPFAVGGPS